MSYQLKRFINFFTSLDLKLSDLISLLVAQFILLNFFVLLINLELLNSIGNSEPLSILNSFEFLVEREENNLKVFLSSEHVHDLEVFFVVSGLNLVVVHWELSILFLVRLEYHAHKECSCNSEEHLLRNPHENDESENEE